MRGDRDPVLGGGLAARRLVVGYALLAVLASGIAIIAWGELPLSHPSPWWSMHPAASAAISGALGMTLASGVIAFTRLAMLHFGWAQRLSMELRPIARALSLPQVLLISGLSSLGEELLFRGVLTSWLGVVPSAVLFGLAHQMRGPSRWVWVGWATAVGLALGAIFAATGSLLGPLLAHAVINAVNLSFLRRDEA